MLSLPVRGNGFAAKLLARMLFPAIRDTVKVSTLYGFEIWVHGNDDVIIERSVYDTGTYEKGTIRVIQQLLKEGDVFVDAGANIGVMSLVASTCVGKTGKIHAFEPFPKIYDRLVANISLNQFTNICVYQLALASVSGEAFLYPDTHHNPGASSLVNPNIGVQPLTVQKQTLDALLNLNEKIALIKIDVEGYEMEVLKGAETILSKPEAPALIVECSTERENYGYCAGDLYEFIKKINHYRIFKLKRGKTHISELVEIKTPADLPQHDNIFCLLPQHVLMVKHD